MKVLMINKFFYIKGGSETYYFALKNLLEKNGHEVIDFSMKNDKNFASPYKKYFIDSVDYNGNSSIMNKIRMSSHIIYSWEAKRKLEALIREVKPDIAHLHIFQHQMSPSILAVLKKYKIPIVYTAHDLKMLCLNYKMLNTTGICERCKNHKYYNCMRFRCIKESRAKSMICMIEGYLHKWLKSYDNINYIITPSKFYYDKFVSFGIQEKRLRYLPNFLEDTGMEVGIEKNIRHLGTYFLYLGRISEEKGILTMIQAMQDTGEQLYIAGTGPQEEEIYQYIAKHKIMNVTMLGFKQQPELTEIVLGAKAIILPSEWYENSPYSGIEAISLGRIIIGAEIGGIPELILNGKNGYLFQPKDVASLKNCIIAVGHKSNEQLLSMQEQSRQLFESRFTAKIHYSELNKIYQQGISEEC